MLNHSIQEEYIVWTEHTNSIHVFGRRVNKNMFFVQCNFACTVHSIQDEYIVWAERNLGR